MGPKKVLLPILLIFLIPIVSAESSIDEKINSIVYYAEQYEVGNIDYLQLRVYGHSITEQINMQLGGEIGPERRGLTRETIEGVFGKPTEMTNWVWVENLKQEKKLDEPLPVWKKIVFDGRKVQISFNAWPFIIEKDDETFTYYSVHFDVRFKKEMKFDIKGSISEIKDAALDYYNTGSGASSLIEKMFNFERYVNDYLEQNRENCADVMEDVFSGDEKKGEMGRVRWRVYPYEGKNFDLRFELHTCDDCDWPWVHIWIDIEMKERGPMPKMEMGKIGEIDREYYRDWSVDEINSEIDKKISNLVNEAKRFDNEMSGDFMRKVMQTNFEIDAMNSMLDEKYYQDEVMRRENYEKRLSVLNDILSRYGSIEKTSFKEIRFEKRLIENTVERRDSWCRHLHDVECAEDEGCFQGICVPALGGNEICDNEVDDDNDNIIDCDDPDCYQEKECGKLCESVCEDTCWKCINEACESGCKECWKCEERGEDCRDVCEIPCWQCTDEKCSSICEECWVCEDEAYGSGCRKKCKSCWECREGGEDCETECEECIPCEDEMKKEDCKNQCGEDESCLEECLKGKDEEDELAYQQCREACKTKYFEKECYRLCDQKVIFICGERRQRIPCEDIINYNCEWGSQDIPCYVYDCPDGTKQTEPCDPTYICDGELQTKPCNVYICNGVKSYMPCEGNITCGQNQELVDNICVCLPGYYDCDDEGNCESTEKCKVGMEICNDGMDNNDDDLIDCQDLITCGGQVCGQDELGNEMRCVEGNCSTAVGCANEGEAWGFGTTVWECCEGLTTLFISTSSGYCTYCGDGVCKSPEDLEVDEELLCPEDCKPEPMTCMNDTDCDDNNPCTQEVCSEGNCSYEEIAPCCGNRKCEEGEDIYTCANDCFQPCPETCCGEECPPGCEEFCPQKCGNHKCEEGEEETCPEDCYECPVHEPPECPDGRIIFMGEDNKGCPLEPICVPIREEECQIDVDCLNVTLCGIAECVDNKCVVTDVTTCVDPECEIGDKKTEDCPDGSEITIAECFDFRWTYTDVECPFFDIICGDGLCQGGENYDTCPDDCPYEEIPKEKIPEEGECVLKEDCGGPQDVCSNGKCVTLPMPVEGLPPEEIATTTTVEEMTTIEETTTVEETTTIEKETTTMEEITTIEKTTTVEVTTEEEVTTIEKTEEATSILGDFLNFITGLFAENKCDWDEDCPSNQFCTRESGLREDIGEFFCTDRCSSKENCPPGMQCDEMRGVCHCERWEGHFDCDGKYENGCESNDATCGGSYNVCDFMEWCDKQPNRYCDPQKGDCLCEEGYYDCDGDWENGCESTHECKGCQSDEDCAADRCAEWGNIIQQFGCFKGETWIEETGVFQLDGGCEYYPKEGVRGHVYFDVWGDPFDELNRMRGEVEQGFESSWCEWELENAKKERQEIQSSLNEEFLRWFFEDYVTTSPSEFGIHVGGIFEIYWGGLVDNSRKTAEMLVCLGRDKFPSEYIPINVEYDTNYGSVKIWEERKTTDMFGGRTEIFSPFMEIWVFPSKDFIKNEMKTSMQEGKLPGPPDQPKEITPAMREEMRENDELMKTVNDLSEKYDGEAKILVSIVDGEETVFQALITVNPDIVVDVKPSAMITETPDVTMTMDFDFLYDMIMFQEKQMRGTEREVPPWEPRPSRMFKGFIDQATMFTKIMGGVATGKIKVSPFGEMQNVMTLMRFVMGGPGEEPHPEED